MQLEESLMSGPVVFKNFNGFLKGKLMEVAPMHQDLVVPSSGSSFSLEALTVEKAAIS